MPVNAQVTLAQAAALRRLAGTGITYPADNGPEISAATRAISLREHDYVPEGLQNNAGDADLRVFAVSPADFQSPPRPEDTLLWHGVRYTIWAIRNSDVGGQTVTYRLFAYRTPPADSVTDGPAGARKIYRPPPSEL